MSIEELLSKLSDAEIELLLNQHKERVTTKYYYKCPICGMMQDDIIVIDTYRIHPVDEVYGYVRDQSWKGASYKAQFNCGHIVDAEEELEAKTREEWGEIYLDEVKV